jgi:hypothetical protein
VGVINPALVKDAIRWSRASVLLALKGFDTKNRIPILLRTGIRVSTFKGSFV